MPVAAMLTRASKSFNVLQGKFYELFEMDAHLGAEVLGLMYMRVSCACCLSPSRV